LDRPVSEFCINIYISSRELQVKRCEILQSIKSIISACNISRPFPQQVVLSVEHCASLVPKQHCWLFSVWAQLDSNSSSQEAAGGLCWTRAWEEEEQRHGSKKLIDGEEEEEEFGLHLDRERWHLLTRRTGRFLLVGRQRRAHVAAQKRVSQSVSQLVIDPLITDDQRKWVYRI
jgi:hypothetical protein